MEIPTALIFDRAELRCIQGRLNKVHSQSRVEREMAQNARSRITELCRSVGLDMGRSQPKFIYVRILHRILDMREGNLEVGCVVTFRTQTGTVAGMTRNGYVEVVLERTVSPKVNVLARNLERRS